MTEKAVEECRPARSLREEKGESRPQESILLGTRTLSLKYEESTVLLSPFTSLSFDKLRMLTS
jgi:hypothetical protein